jgi:hypothetical protein
LKNGSEGISISTLKIAFVKVSNNKAYDVGVYSG